MILAEPIHADDHDPSDLLRFFRNQIDQVDGFVKAREIACLGAPSASCNTNLFFGFFFDGTRNNYALDDKRETLSNVARLFDAYPGQRITSGAVLGSSSPFPDEGRYPNFFRFYAPGVGTPFVEVGDSGTGAFDRTGGAAVALRAERRIIWALAQSINAVNRFFNKTVLLTTADVNELVGSIALDAGELKSEFWHRGGGKTINVLRRQLRRLHDSIAPHIPDSKTGNPSKIDPGIVKKVYVSAFGFSRGAAAARAFTSWFVKLCSIDAHMLGRTGLTLGGFPVIFDFLGIFDTVASVGGAPIALMTDGHAAWADADVTLRVPAGVKCLHLVAAHEVRRSFALDSISDRGVYTADLREIIFPGAHSDVGGGYAPGEQGRGTDPFGADLLSRIPLAFMYREARLSGVPLKLEKALPVAKRRFLIASGTIADFNAYVAAAWDYSKKRKVRPGDIRAMMRSQMEPFILWRRAERGKIDRQAGYRRATRQEERNDLLSADLDFARECEEFERWAGNRWPLGWQLLSTWTDAHGASTAAGWASERFREWPDLKDVWFQNDPVSEPMTRLFEQHVHDSRAAFKIGAPEAHEWEDELKKWVNHYRAYQRAEAVAAVNRSVHRPLLNLSQEQLRHAKYYMSTGKVPQMYVQGREPLELGAGYLRFRRVYRGSDSDYVAEAQTFETATAAFG